MRQIGVIPDPDRAEQFAAYLRAGGTGCSVDLTAQGGLVWIQDEDRVAAAKEELHQFLSEPDHERYRDATRRAAAVAREQQRQHKAVRQQTVDLRDRWDQPIVASCPVTFGLLSLMTIAAILTGFDPPKHEVLYERMIFSADWTWQSILSGEVWRIVTPIFLHFGFWHFLFNLFYLRDFGFHIEYRLGTPKFVVMVLTIAVLSNAAQFLATGPFFGGMSGVNYGLFGYAWLRGKLDPDSGFFVPNQTVTIMCVWHVLCVLNIIPNVGNWAHGVGLIVGATLGAIVPLWKSLTGRK